MSNYTYSLSRYSTLFKYYDNEIIKSWMFHHIEFIHVNINVDQFIVDYVYIQHVHTSTRTLLDTSSVIVMANQGHVAEWVFYTRWPFARIGCLVLRLVQYWSLSNLPSALADYTAVQIQLSLLPVNFIFFLELVVLSFLVTIYSSCFLGCFILPVVKFHNLIHVIRIDWVLITLILMWYLNQ